MVFAIGGVGKVKWITAVPNEDRHGTILQISYMDVERIQIPSCINPLSTQQQLVHWLPIPLHLTTKKEDDLQIRWRDKEPNIQVCKPYPAMWRTLHGSRWPEQSACCPRNAQCCAAICEKIIEQFDNSCQKLASCKAWCEWRIWSIRWINHVQIHIVQPAIILHERLHQGNYNCFRVLKSRVYGQTEKLRVQNTDHFLTTNLKWWFIPYSRSGWCRETF